MHPIIPFIEAKENAAFIELEGVEAIFGSILGRTRATEEGHFVVMVAGDLHVTKTCIPEFAMIMAE